jgi:aspartate kinase
MNQTLTMKFGGTSVGSVSAIRQSAQLIKSAKADWKNVIVVVSAMSKVTNLLIEGTQAATLGQNKRYLNIADELTRLHSDVIFELLTSQAEQDHAYGRLTAHINEFKSLCHAIEILGEASPRAMDVVSSLGERINYHVVAAHLREIGVSAEAVLATELIRTDSVFQSASPDMLISRQITQTRLNPLLEAGSVPVVTGFLGATEQGAITTLGRGGSDYSGAIVAACSDSQELWIWTDVPGVMTGDPRVVKHARTLPKVTYREVSELAYYGAKVLHPKTIRPVLESGTALWVKNTFDPNGEATLIVQDGSPTDSVSPLRAVTAIKGQTMITVEGRGMIGVQGIAARTFGAVARAHASVTLITQASSEQSICFSVPTSDGRRVVAALEEEFSRELHRRDIDSILTLDDVVIVTVVGSGMQHTPGVSGRIFSALGNKGLNIIAIAQGSSECAISLVTSAADADESVRTIHELIVGEN